MAPLQKSGGCSSKNQEPRINHFVMNPSGAIARWGERICEEGASGLKGLQKTGEAKGKAVKRKSWR